MTAGPVCLRSPIFLLDVGSCFVLVGTSEKLHMRIMGDVWSGTIREASVKSVWRVDYLWLC
jgi:hypothetical protein